MRPSLKRGDPVLVNVDGVAREALVVDIGHNTISGHEWVFTYELRGERDEDQEIDYWVGSGGRPAGQEAMIDKAMAMGAMLASGTVEIARTEVTVVTRVGGEICLDQGVATSGNDEVLVVETASAHYGVLVRDEGGVWARGHVHSNTAAGRALLAAAAMARPGEFGLDTTATVLVRIPPEKR